MSAIFGITPRVKTLESIMGRRQKNLFDESVGLARSFSRAHWFLELTSLAIIRSATTVQIIMSTCKMNMSSSQLFMSTCEIFMVTCQKILLVCQLDSTNCPWNI